MSHDLVRREPGKRWKAVPANFCDSGITIYLVTLNGEKSPSHVTAKSLEECLKDGLTDEHKMLIRAQWKREFVELNGEEHSIPIIELRAFYEICLNHPSPKLKGYRQRVAEIVDNVQRHGSHVEHDVGPQAYVPPELRGTLIGTMLGTVNHMAVEQHRMAGRIDVVEQQVASAEQKAQAAIELHSGKVDQMTLKGWLKIHGKKAETGRDKLIGQRLSAWCDDRGYKKEIINDVQFGQLRAYPRDILERFIPSGIPQNWLVKLNQ